MREIAFPHYSVWLCHYPLILYCYWLMQPVKTWPAGCNAVVEMCKIFHSKFTPLMGGMCMAERRRGVKPQQPKWTSLLFILAWTSICGEHFGGQMPLFFIIRTGSYLKHVTTSDVPQAHPAPDKPVSQCKNSVTLQFKYYYGLMQPVRCSPRDIRQKNKIVFYACRTSQQ